MRGVIGCMLDVWGGKVDVIETATSIGFPSNLSNVDRWSGLLPLTILSRCKLPSRSLPSASTPPPWLHDPLVFGTLCGLASALGYTAANACLRAVSGCDAVWVSCVKAFPTVAIFGPILLYRLARGRDALPPARQMAALVGASVICQLLGNVVFQWSLGVVGMALAVPLTLGMMIVAGAIMGRILLHESVTIPMAISTVVLIGAMFVLSLGANEASQSMAHQRGAPRSGWWRPAWVPPARQASPMPCWVW